MIGTYLPDQYSAVSTLSEYSLTERKDEWKPTNYKHALQSCSTTSFLNLGY